MGVELVDTTPELREHLGGKPDVRGLVGKVLEGSAAEKGGGKVEDLLISIGGESVETPGEVIRAVGRNAGKTVEIEVVRNGRAQTLPVALPEEEEEGGSLARPRARVVVPASIVAALGGVVTPDNQLCCDGGKAIVSFARKAKIPCCILPKPGGPRPEAPNLHINNVNAYHGRLKEWLRPVPRRRHREPEPLPGLAPRCRNERRQRHTAGLATGSTGCAENP